MENLRLVVRDGKRNDFTDVGPFSLIRAYDSLKEGGRLDALFYGHKNPATPVDFLYYVNTPSNWVYGIYDFDNDELLCLVIINNPFGRCAMFHFCFTTLCIGREVGVSAQFFKIMSPHFSQFIGVTPKPYRHVISLAKAMGADIITEIKDACYLGKKNKYVNGVLVRYNLGG